MHVKIIYIMFPYTVRALYQAAEAPFCVLTGDVKARIICGTGGLNPMGMGVKGRIEEVLDRLRPKLEELAWGYAELISFDQDTGVATLCLFGGRLH
jgi:hypothetical protein